MIISDQTQEQKRQVYLEFLTWMKRSGIQELADTVHNWTTITAHIEATGEPVSHASIVKAINTLGHPKLEWLASRAQQAAQAAAQKAQADEIAAVNKALKDARDAYGLADTQHNADHLATFLTTSTLYKGKFSETAFKHWIREFLDTGVLDRIAAAPAQQPKLTPSGFLKERDTWAEERAAARDRAQQKVKDIRTMLEFKSAVRDALRITVNTPDSEYSLGRLSHSATAEARIAKLQELQKTFPQYSGELDALIRKQEEIFKF